LIFVQKSLIFFVPTNFLISLLLLSKFLRIFIPMRCPALGVVCKDFRVGEAAAHLAGNVDWGGGGVRVTY
jgi:hypothetical protein